MSSQRETPTAARRDDLALVRAALAGDRDAETRLVERLDCLAAILRHHNRRLSAPLPEPDFLDLVQDTAVALWRKLPGFDGRAALETWAYRFCTYQFLAYLRDAHRVPTLVEDFTPLEETEPGLQQRPSSDPTVDVEHALGLLEPDEERVVRLKHYDGLTFEALARELGTSPNTAKTRYYRAMLKLREHLRGRYPELYGDVEPVREGVR